MAKVGRPNREIDKQQFESLCAIPFVTVDSCSDVLKVHRNTLMRWVQKEYKTNFETIKNQKQEGLKLKLAGKQLELAMKGNVALLIFLGKNMLGQSDKVEHQGNANKPFNLNYTKAELANFIEEKPIEKTIDVEKIN